MAIKLLYFDVETGGLDFKKNCIHQLSGIIEIGGVEKQRFNYRIAPHPSGIMEDEALAISHTTRADLATFPSQQVVFKELCTILGQYVDKFNKYDKFHLVGYNSASFDNPFLRAFFKQCGDDYFGSWFWSVPIDVMVLAGQYLLNERNGMPNFKQSTVAKHFGIEIDETRLHDAVYDVEVLIQIYKYMYPI